MESHLPNPPNLPHRFVFLAGLFAALISVLLLGLVPAASRLALPPQAAAGAGWPSSSLAPTTDLAVQSRPRPKDSGTTSDATGPRPSDGLPTGASAVRATPGQADSDVGGSALTTLRAQLAAGQTAAAGAVIETVEGTLGGHPARLAGEDAQAQARYHAALGWYKRALAAGLARAHQAKVAERLGQSAEALGDWPAAVTYYQQAGALAETPGLRAEAAYHEAQNRGRTGDHEGARRLWAATARSYPATRYGARSLEALGADGRDRVPAATRAAIYAAQGEFESAIEAYTEAILAAGDPAEAFELYYQRAYVRLRNDDPSAQVDFRYILRQAPDHPRADDALWHLARTEQVPDEHEVVRERYLTLATQYPGSSYADDALVEAALLAWRSSDQAGALETLRWASAAYPQSDSASRALFWRGKIAA